MSAEDWAALKEDGKARKQERERFNRELVECLAGDLDYDFEIEMISPFQMRLTMKGKKLDYFPQSGRATWVGSGKWFLIGDIEKFLNQNAKC